MYENFVTLTGEQQQQQKFTQLLIDDITTWRSWNHMISHANGVPCKNNGRMIHWDARYDITWYHMHVNIADATTTGAWFIESNRSINLSLIFYPCIQHMWLQTSLSVSKTDCSKFFFPSFSTFNSNLVVNHAVYVNTLLTTDLQVRQTPPAEGPCHSHECCIFWHIGRTTFNFTNFSTRVKQTSARDCSLLLWM